MIGKARRKRRRHMAILPRPSPFGRDAQAEISPAKPNSPGGLHFTAAAALADESRTALKPASAFANPGWRASEREKAPAAALKS